MKKALISLKTALIISLCFSGSTFAESVDAQITSMNGQITQATANYTKAEKGVMELIKKYPPYLITGEIKSTQPFIVFGNAIGPGVGMTQSSKIQIINPSKSGMSLTVYAGQHFFVNKKVINGESISVFGDPPKELVTAKVQMDNAKKALNNLNAKKKQLLDKKAGIETITFSSGQYIGTVKNGMPHGKGKFIWKNGDVYEGDWVNNEITGKGKFTWKNGDVYEGDFINAIRSGNGKLSSGYVPKEKVISIGGSEGYYTFEYTGEFKNDNYHGQGSLKYMPSPDKMFTEKPYTYIGEFKNGVIDGYGTVYDYDGNVLGKGIWKDGDIVQLDNAEE